MAKITAPLLSMGGSGTIGKSVTFGKWRGVAYARQRVIPANPRTTAQQNNRTRFALLREMWKLAPPLVVAPWNAFASGRPFTGMNKFVGENNRLLKGEADFAKALMSPGAGGGLPPTTMSAAPGSSAGEVDITIAAPDQLPEGWTITQAVACAFPEQDPVGIFAGPFVAGFDASSTYEITLAGFDGVPSVACFGWIEYEKANGATAYSVSLYDETAPGT